MLGTAPRYKARLGRASRLLYSQKEKSEGMASLQKGVNEAQKPHAVCVPYPAQGHINPILKLAKILHSRGFHITFVNTELNHRALLRSGGPTALDGLPSFRFETIPDGLHTNNDDQLDVTPDIPALCRSTELHCLRPFMDLLHRLDHPAGDAPPVSCIVADAAMFFTLDAAQKLGIPGVLLFTASACGFLGYAQYDKLVDLGLIPFKDANFLTNGDLDRIADWVPSMKGIRLKDLPAFMRTTDPEEFMLGHLRRKVQTAKRASAILFNSFDALEHDVLQSLSSDFPPVYAIGPLQFLLEPIEVEDDKTKSIGSSLWKEDPNCLAWLNSFGPESVVYVNFGSITTLTNDQLVEIAWGLANSNHPFLWITRPDMVTGKSAVLPPEFLEETKNRGLLVSWCNQEQVLAHPAIGGFLTHCGWNSTLESISNGIPMICSPFFAEQQTNCWFCCRKWGIGMEIDHDSGAKRHEVERLVRELMEGENGKEMKQKAMEWKRLAREAALPPNGSSYSNLDHVITKVLSHRVNGG
ncbi:hypothetical protein Cgig2_006436 [Carnegiea gigantea]|uniref:Glycosyltransferase n=1 Tax=Carnegiea gigantea TaxID=171969 RepID=A0A9Q1KAE0_9CARY|nr:hypothetical protein Cgig2_006436 [Carnegiea gigantea]